MRASGERFLTVVQNSIIELVSVFCLTIEPRTMYKIHPACFILNRMDNTIPIIFRPYIFKIITN